MVCWSVAGLILVARWHFKGVCQVFDDSIGSFDTRIIFEEVLEMLRVLQFDHIFGLIAIVVVFLGGSAT